MSSFLIIWVFLFHNEHSFLCFCKAFHQLLETDTIDIRHVSVINNNMVQSVPDQQPKQNHSPASSFDHGLSGQWRCGGTQWSFPWSTPRTDHWRDFGLNHHEVYSGIRQSYPIGVGHPSKPGSSEASKQARMLDQPGPWGPRINQIH